MRGDKSRHVKVRSRGKSQVKKVLGGRRRRQDVKIREEAPKNVRKGRTRTLSVRGARPATSKNSTRMGKEKLSKQKLHLFPSVTVSVAVRHVKKELLERAVESVLQQSYSNVLVIVTSDGEEIPSWEGCSFVSDPRVVCWKTTKRMGPYFIHELARRAGGNPLFAVQDSDDWSDRQRLEKLIQALQESDVDAAVPSVVRHEQGRTSVVSPTPAKLVGKFRHRLDHFWVVRDEALDVFGGYWVGTFMGADTLLTNLLLDHGALVGVPAAVYHRHVRKGSLTTAKDTGFGSAARQKAANKLSQLYRDGLVAVQEEARKSTNSPVFLENFQILKGLLNKPDADDIEVVLSAFPFTAWSVSRTCAVALFRHCMVHKPKLIVDFGSGASTLAFALYAAKEGAKVISLEHDESFCETTRKALCEAGLEAHVDLQVAPLVPVSSGPFRGLGYRFVLDQGEKVDFAFIDGPPEKIGRMMTFPLLQDHLSPTWVVWLHDALRPGERKAVSAWSKVYGSFKVELSTVEDSRGVYKLSRA